jgi:hypothetical protein
MFVYILCNYLALLIYEIHVFQLYKTELLNNSILSFLIIPGTWGNHR